MAKKFGVHLIFREGTDGIAAIFLPSTMPRLREAQTSWGKFQSILKTVKHGEIFLTNIVSEEDSLQVFGDGKG